MSCSPMTARSAVSKPEFEADHRERNLMGRPRQRRRPGRRIHEVEKAMIGEDMAHALARTLAPERDDDALARRLQRVDMGFDGLEHIDVRAAPAPARNCAPAACRRRARLAAGSAAKGNSRTSLASSMRCAPFGVGKIEALRRQRLVGDASSPRVAAEFFSGPCVSACRRAS